MKESPNCYLVMDHVDAMNAVILLNGSNCCSCFDYPYKHDCYILVVDHKCHLFDGRNHSVRNA